MVSAAIISGAIAAGTAIYGGISKSNAARRQKRAEEAELARERAENRNWYNRRYYEDGTQRADVQQILQTAKSHYMDMTNALIGRNAVMGGSNASVAAAKEKANQAYASMVSNAAARAEARKDSVENSYRTTENQLGRQQRSMDRYYGEAQQQAIDTAVTGLGNAASSAISTFAKNGAAADAATRAADATPANTVKPEDVSNAASQYSVNDNAVNNTANAMAETRTDLTSQQLSDNAAKAVASNGGVQKTAPTLSEQMFAQGSNDVDEAKILKIAEMTGRDPADVYDEYYGHNTAPGQTLKEAGILISPKWGF